MLVAFLGFYVNLLNDVLKPIFYFYNIDIYSILWMSNSYRALYDIIYEFKKDWLNLFFLNRQYLYKYYLNFLNKNFSFNLLLKEKLVNDEDDLLLINSGSTNLNQYVTDNTSILLQNKIKNNLDENSLSIQVLNNNNNNLYNYYRFYNLDYLFMNLIKKGFLNNIIFEKLNINDFMVFKESMLDLTFLNYDRFLPLEAIAVTDADFMTEEDLEIFNFVELIKEPLTNFSDNDVSYNSYELNEMEINEYNELISKITKYNYIFDITNYNKKTDTLWFLKNINYKFNMDLNKYVDYILLKKDEFDIDIFFNDIDDVSYEIIQYFLYNFNYTENIMQFKKNIIQYFDENKILIVFFNNHNIYNKINIKMGLYNEDIELKEEYFDEILFIDWDFDNFNLSEYKNMLNTNEEELKKMELNEDENEEEEIFDIANSFNNFNDFKIYCFEIFFKAVNLQEFFFNFVDNNVEYLKEPTYHNKKTLNTYLDYLDIINKKIFIKNSKNINFLKDIFYTNFFNSTSLIHLQKYNIEYIKSDKELIAYFNFIHNKKFNDNWDILIKYLKLLKLYKHSKYPAWNLLEHLKLQEKNKRYYIDINTIDLKNVWKDLEHYVRVQNWNKFVYKMQELTDDALCAVPQYKFIKNLNDLIVYLQNANLKYELSVCSFQYGLGKMLQEHKQQLFYVQRQGQFFEDTYIKSEYEECMKLLNILDRKEYRSKYYKTIRLMQNKELKILFVNLFEFEARDTLFEVESGPYLKYKIRKPFDYWEGMSYDYLGVIKEYVYQSMINKGLWGLYVLHIKDKFQLKWAQKLDWCNFFLYMQHRHNIFLREAAYGFLSYEAQAELTETWKEVSEIFVFEKPEVNSNEAESMESESFENSFEDIDIYFDFEFFKKNYLNKDWNLYNYNCYNRDKFWFNWYKNKDI